MVILQNNLFLSCILYLQPFPYKQKNYKKKSKQNREYMNRRLSKYCILRLHKSWMKFVQKYDIIQCSTKKILSSWKSKIVWSQGPKITNLKNYHFFFNSKFLHSITNNGRLGGGCYCSTMCQYNKWNYHHRDSIMPCIDQWTLTGSMPCVGVRICLSPEFLSVSSQAPWSPSVWQWPSPRWTSPSGASGEW